MNISISWRFKDGQEPLSSMMVQTWFQEDSMLVRNLSIHEGTNNCQEPFGSLKEQMFVRNLSIPWRNKCSSGTSRFHEGSVRHEPPVSMGGQSSMSYVVPELLHSMKVPSWTRTSWIHGRFKFDVEWCSGTFQFTKVKRLEMNLPTLWEVQVGCSMWFRNPSIPWSFKVAEEPLNSIEGSGSVSQDFPKCNMEEEGRLEALHV